MARTACHRFNVLDAMVLVAAVALGAFLTRVKFEEYQRLGLFQVEWDWEIALERIVNWSQPWLVAGTIAFGIIRLRQPRPSARRLTC